MAVVLMRGTLAISGPAGQRNRNISTVNKGVVPELLFCVAERKDRCKSVMFCTCLSSASHCCSFVRQPSRAEAFHRSPCRNPPSLKNTQEAVTRRPTQTKVKATKAKSERANRQRVGTRRAALQTDVDN